MHSTAFEFYPICIGRLGEPPERVLCRNVEMSEMTKEPGEIRGEQSDQLPARAGIPCVRRFQQHVERGLVVNSEPAAPAVEDVAMPLEQLNARQP